MNRQTKARDGPHAQPLRREHMPTDFSLSLGSYLGGDPRTAQRIPEDFGPRQPMRGFEETYHNIIDYIVRITHRIWEERKVEYILGRNPEYNRAYQDHKEGKTAVAYAVGLACDDIAKAIYERRAGDFGVDKLDKKGLAAIHLVALRDTESIDLMRDLLPRQQNRGGLHHP